MQLVPPALSHAFLPYILHVFYNFFYLQMKHFGEKRISPDFKIIPQIKDQGFWDVFPR
jgi:hypothetical protein